MRKHKSNALQKKAKGALRVVVQLIPQESLNIDDMSMMLEIIDLMVE